MTQNGPRKCVKNIFPVRSRDIRVLGRPAIRVASSMPNNSLGAVRPRLPRTELMPLPWKKSREPETTSVSLSASQPGKRLAGLLACLRLSLRSCLGCRSACRPLFVCWPPPRGGSAACPLFWRFFWATVAPFALWALSARSARRCVGLASLFNHSTALYIEPHRD